MRSSASFGIYAWVECGRINKLVSRKENPSVVSLSLHIKGIHVCVCEQFSIEHTHSTCRLNVFDLWRSDKMSMCEETRWLRRIGRKKTARETRREYQMRKTLSFSACEGDDARFSTRVWMWFKITFARSGSIHGWKDGQMDGSLSGASSNASATICSKNPLVYQSVRVCVCVVDIR